MFDPILLIKWSAAIIMMLFTLAVVGSFVGIIILFILNLLFPQEEE